MKPPRARRIFFVALSAALLAGRLTAVTMVLTPAKDNTIYGPTDKSNGAGAELFAGRSGHGNVLRGLLAFDVAGQIPAGAVIDSASLTLTITTPLASIANTVDLHRLLADWGQGLSVAGSGGGGGALAATGDATWNTRFFNTSGTTWTTAGGDFSGTVSARQFVTGSSGTVALASAGLAADVQGWLDHPEANFGWMLVAEDEVSNGAAVRFSSREAATGRPALTVNFSTAPIPEPSAGAVLAGGGMLVAAFWCRRKG